MRFFIIKKGDLLLKYTLSGHRINKLYGQHTRVCLKNACAGPDTLWYLPAGKKVLEYKLNNGSHGSGPYP